jgi:hypothetical protein
VRYCTCCRASLLPESSSLLGLSKTCTQHTFRGLGVSLQHDGLAGRTIGAKTRLPPRGAKRVVAREPEPKGAREAPITSSYSLRSCVIGCYHKLRDLSERTESGSGLHDKQAGTTSLGADCHWSQTTKDIHVGL